MEGVGSKNEAFMRSNEQQHIVLIIAIATLHLDTNNRREIKGLLMYRYGGK
jgi:hypothetical protein